MWFPRELDETERDAVEKYILNTENLVSELEKHSIEGILESIKSCEESKRAIEQLLHGTHPTEPMHFFAERTIKMLDEQIFCMKWIEKGFQGMKKCSELYVSECEEELLGGKS